jgi:N-acetylglutamate synthase-like GNAT family acetyltransferase
MGAPVFASEWVRPSNAKDAPAVRGLLLAEGLEHEFNPKEFVVCEADGRIVGCARAKPLPEGGTELASVAVARTHRGRGLARSLVQMVLLGARHPVFALTLVPEMLVRGGFEPIPVEELPSSLQAKAGACSASGRPWTAMRLRRVEVRPMPPEPDSEPDFLDT